MRNVAEGPGVCEDAETLFAERVGDEGGGVAAQTTGLGGAGGVVVCGHGHGETSEGGAEQDAGVAEVGGDEGRGGGRVPEGGGAPGVGVSWGGGGRGGEGEKRRGRRKEEGKGKEGVKVRGGRGGRGGGEEGKEKEEKEEESKRKRKRARAGGREQKEERKRRSYAVDISARLAVDPPLNGFAPAFGSAAISPVVFSPRRNHGHVLVIKSMSAFRKAYISTPSTARQSPKSG